MTSAELPRRLLTVMLLLAHYVLPNAAVSDTPDNERARALLPKSLLELRVVETLRVNSSNQFRMVVFDKCEARGLDDIRELVASSKFEELWAFVPGGESADCHWIEIGAEASAESESASVKVDWDYLESLMAKYSRLYLYHFHPLEYFHRCEPGPGCNGQSVPVRAGDAAVSDLIVNLQYAMPSAEDIYFMSESAWRLDQHHPETGVMRHRVVSPYGVVEYGLSDSGKRRYAANRGSRMEGLYIKLMAANALADEHIQNAIRACPESMTAALERLAASMNSANLRVVVRSFD